MSQEDHNVTCHRKTTVVRHVLVGGQALVMCQLCMEMRSLKRV
jgi:hypothetical protein